MYDHIDKLYGSDRALYTVWKIVVPTVKVDAIGKVEYSLRALFPA